jgi:RNA 2',3'-cyclic 3'-phosphodiesterase
MSALALRLGHRYDLWHRVTERARLHATLCFIGPFGSLTETQFAEIGHAVSSLAMPPFIAEFDRVMIFGQPTGKLVLCGDDGVTGIGMLHHELAVAMRMIGFRHWERKFTPHVTLNYGDCIVPEQQVREIRWHVTDVSLVCSAYGRGKHFVLHTWPLKAPKRFH